ncbi:CHAT domain-containing protein [Nocardioides donggukensis]|uniref:CHAT domain-containing protein n=1 Tax=Nocardioides donggukensis TaxID=2774019 RepID=A0A927K4D8_9ACTN|nr:CHAT domain-containing protein [Nocardioides donggukensis]MBD8869508.1 CHAT domain-containing protein [Nocardioides donggukensis]
MTQQLDLLVEDLLGAPDLGARLGLLRAAGTVDREGLLWLEDEVEARIHTAPARARTLAELCVRAAEELGLPRSAARAEYLLARVVAEAGDLEGALGLIASARERYRSVGDEVLALRTDLGRMQVLDDLGDHRGAVEVGNRVLRTLPQAGGDRVAAAAVEAAVMCNLGVAHSFLGDHETSLGLYARAETAYAGLHQPVQVAQQRANQGIELLALGQAREARARLCSARAEFARAGDHLWTAKCAAHLADAHQHLGELVDALALLDEAGSELEDLGATAELLRVHVQRARTYLSAGLFDESAAEADRAIAEAQELSMGHDEGFARLTKAAAQLSAGLLVEAGVELDAAIDIFDRVGDRQFRASADLLRAELADRLGDDDARHEALSRALGALEAGGWLIPLGWALLKHVDLSEDAGERSRALDRADEIVATVGVPALRHGLAVRRARLSAERGAHHETVRLLGDAVADVQRSGSGLPDPILRLAFRTSHMAAFDDLVDALVRRGTDGDPARALRYSDDAKARTLLDLITGTIGSRGGDGAVERDGDDRLGRSMADLRSTYAVLGDSAGEDGLADHLARAERLETEVSSLRVRAASSFRVPGPRRAHHDDPAPDEGPPSISYHCHGQDVIAFVSRGSGVVTERLVGVLPRVRHLIDDLESQWARFQLGSGFVDHHHDALLLTCRAVLGDLHDLVWAPLRTHLADLATAELVVVPHGPLHRVPFHALFDGTAHLVDGWILSVAPTTPRAAVAGPAPVPARDVRVLAVPDVRSPLIADEARAIGELFPNAAVHIGRGTSLGVLRGLGEQAIVHVACQGMFRPDNPLFSAIRMGDHWVTGVDVLEADLRGALVTLSACESGRPGAGAAEPVGLAWSFLAAGAAGVVVSQWLVDDATTLELMVEMYRHIADGEPTPSALAAAQRLVASHHPHPYHWAAFSYVSAPPVRTLEVLP